MGKIGKLFRAISKIISEPSLLNLVIDGSDHHQQSAIKSGAPVAGLKQINLLNLEDENRLVIEPFAFLEGGSLPTDLALLNTVTQKFTDTQYFEIGTWRGESVANVAKFCQRCVTLNLSSDEIVALTGNKAYADLHGHYSKSISNVEHIEGNSLTFDFSKYKGLFDVVFIDGDHHYESVKKDTVSGFELIKNDDSIIVWHDYGNGPEDIRWDVFRGIWEGTPAEKRKHLYRVENTLCAIYYPYDIESLQQSFPQNPNFDFKVMLESKRVK